MGGKGSGDFEHSGRKGEVGGSGPGGTEKPRTSVKDLQKKYSIRDAENLVQRGVSSLVVSSVTNQVGLIATDKFEKGHFLSSGDAFETVADLNRLNDREATSKNFNKASRIAFNYQDTWDNMTEGSYDTKEDWLSTIKTHEDFKWVMSRAESFISNEKSLREYQ
jgi:hypothetical protein